MSADQLIAHALDLFALLGPDVTARKMFGGVGFYAGGRFFAIAGMGDEALYLKVDEVTRGQFEAAGGRPFTYPARDGSLMVMSYLTPPDEAMEDPEAMLPWARLGVEAAARKARPAAKPKPKPKPAAKPKRAVKLTRAVKPKPAGKPIPASKHSGGGTTRRATRRR